MCTNDFVKLLNDVLNNLALIKLAYHCFTVDPLYNDIRYNHKIVITSILSAQNQRIVYFYIDIPILFFRKTYVLCIC